MQTKVMESWVLAPERIAMAQVRPDLEETVQDFKRKYFRPFTVGLQIRCAPSDTTRSCMVALCACYVERMQHEGGTPAFTNGHWYPSMLCALSWRHTA